MILDELAAALDARDWPRALGLALAAWRANRAPELADLVDRVGARCDPPPRRRRDFHGWWMHHARSHDPATVTALLAQIAMHVPLGSAYWSILPRAPVVTLFEQLAPSGRGAFGLDRLAAILAWPDDPRIARLCAAWLTDPADNPPPWLYRIYDSLAIRLAALADVRVLPRLAAYLGAHPEPRARSAAEEPAVARHHSIAKLYTTLAAAAPAPSLPDSLRAQIAALERTEIDRLWRELGERPDDRGLRGVLADTLIEAGDRRGELIALQLAVERDPSPTPARDPRLRRLQRLIEIEWNHSLAGVTGIAVRRPSEFRGGMLEVLGVGRPETPRWAWVIAREHRELCAVHTVRPFQVDESNYAAFLTGLPHLRTLELASPHTPHALRAIGARLPITCLEYRHPQDATGRSHIPEALALMAQIAPDIQRIVLHAAPLGASHGEIAALFAAQFPGREIITRVADPRPLTGR